MIAYLLEKPPAMPYDDGENMSTAAKLGIVCISGKSTWSDRAEVDKKGIVIPQVCNGNEISRDF